MKLLLALFVACSSLMACSGPSEQGSSTEAISDILSMQRRADGRFDVVCRSGTREVASDADIRSDRVCSDDGSTSECLGNGRTFTVLAASGTKTYRTDYDIRTYSCGPKVSAAYDGRYLYTYDAALDRFTYNRIDNDRANAEIWISGNLAAIYDGRYLFVYDATVGSYSYNRIDNDVLAPKYLISNEGLLLYDTRYVFSYCSANRRYDYESVEANVSQVLSRALSDRLVMVVGSDAVTLNTSTCDLSSD